MIGSMIGIGSEKRLTIGVAMIRILHTGDIHLDSPFSGLDPRRAEIRRNELRAAFTSMMTYVRMNEVDILLIAGDLFDGDFATRETVGLIIRELEKCRAKVFITAGNHDFISRSSVYSKEGIFPENVFVFKDENVEKVSLDELGVDVYGFSFLSPYLYENPIVGHRVENEDRLNLLVCHADTRSASSAYCPIDEKMICDFGADYTALGHIHNAGDVKNAGGHIYGYCGCLEGRDFGETGVKGALLVECDKDGDNTVIKAKRIRFSKRRYESEVLYVDGASSMGEVKDAVERFISERGYGDETLLSLTLKGSVSPSLVINTDTLAEDIGGLFFLEISDGTVPDPEGDKLESDATVKGQFYRELLPYLSDENGEKSAVAAAALRYGLSALEGENIIDFN